MGGSDNNTTMDIFLAILAIVLVIIGVVGSIVPVIPGPPLAYLALLLAKWSHYADYSNEFLITWAVITIVVTILDYYLPIFFTKKFGGSKYATWGATIGLVIGLFLGPVGIILGPFIGAYVGETIHDRSDNAKVWKVAFGSFVAFIFGTGLKLVSSIMMAYQVFKGIFF